MNKKEVAEIKRRLKKESCTIQHMCGCYVDAEKNKLVTFSQKFLNLEEDEFYKYLEKHSPVPSETIFWNLNFRSMRKPLAADSRSLWHCVPAS